MNLQLRLLLAGYSPATTTSLVHILQHAGYMVLLKEAQTLDVIQQLLQEPWDVLMVNGISTTIDVFDALSLTRATRHHISFIVMPDESMVDEQTDEYNDTEQLNRIRNADIDGYVATLHDDELLVSIHNALKIDYCTKEAICAFDGTDSHVFCIDETLLQEAFFDSPCAIAFIALSTQHIVQANKLFQDIVGVTRNTMHSEPTRWLDCFLHDTERLYIEQHIKEGISFDAIALTIQPAQQHPQRMSCSLCVLAEHTPPYAIITLYQQHYHTADVLENELSTALLNTEVVLVVVLDTHGNIVRFNRACELLTGYLFGSIQGTSLVDLLIPKAFQEQERDHLAHMITHQKPSHYEGIWITRTGEQRYIAWSQTFLCKGDGAISSVVNIGLDITEQKRIEERVQNQITRIAVLRRIQMDISAHLDYHMTLTQLLDHVTKLFHVDAATVLVYVPHKNVLEYAVGKGFRTTAIQWSRMRLGEGCAGRAVLERHVVSIPNVHDKVGCCVRSHMLRKEGFVSYYGIPLIAKGQIKGVLELFHKTPLEFDAESQSFLDALVGHAAVIMDNAELVEHLKHSKDELTKAYASLQHSKDEVVEAYEATIEGWARALELRDAETEGHSRRVTQLTVDLARAMGVSERAIVHIRRGAILHDIGKMAIPDSILLKPGPLTDEERTIMNQHPIFAYKMLLQVHFLKQALDIPYLHHERWDGNGYPLGLQGENIPLAARIFSVVDVWDALSSDRPYRAAWQQQQVVEYLQHHAGTHFDPNVVRAFVCLLEERTTHGEKNI